MTRTLLVTLDFPPMTGGVASYWANLSRLMPSADFFVLAEESDSSMDFDINQLYLIYRETLFSRRRWVWPKWLPLVFKIYRLARRLGVKKIIVTHVLPVGTIALILKRFCKMSYVVSCHGLDLMLAQKNGRKKWLARLILRQAEKIIVNSEFTGRALAAFGAGLVDKVHIVYPCPNVARPANVPRGEFLKKYGLEDKRIVLTVGRLIERKGHDRVIAAMARVLARFPDVQYLIVGRGAGLDDLQRLTREGNLERPVKFFTDIRDTELPAFYENADIFIMPSRQLADGDVEGFGMVYLEANAYGLPVIAGRSGGAVEAVEHSVNGLLVDPENVNDITQAIVSLLDNPNRARELGERGRRRVAERFTWSEQVKELIKALE